MTDNKNNRNAEQIRLTTEGHWYHGDYPILHERTIQFFNRNINRDAQGKYFLSGEDKPIFFTVEDTPFFIIKIEKTIAGFLITLNDDTIELLNLSTLWTKSQNSLYCVVKGGQFKAKFLRTTYNEMAQSIEQNGKKFVLVFQNKKYPIADKAPDLKVPEFHKNEISKKTEKKKSPVKKQHNPAKKPAPKKPVKKQTPKKETKKVVKKKKR